MATRTTTTRDSAAKKTSAAKPSSRAKEASTALLSEGINHGQFFHAKAYAITKGQKRPSTGGGKRKGRKKADIRSIIGELLRPQGQPHFYPHLLSQGLTPKPPIFLGGEGIVETEQGMWAYYEELQVKASKITKTITPKKGKAYQRRQAKSETILGTAILSWPGPYNPDNPQQAKWIELSVQWLKEKYAKSGDDRASSR